MTRYFKKLTLGVSKSLTASGVDRRGDIPVGRIIGVKRWVVHLPTVRYVIVIAIQDILHDIHEVGWLIGVDIYILRQDFQSGMPRS